MLFEIICYAGFAIGCLSLLLFSIGHAGLLTLPFITASVITSLAFFLYLTLRLSLNSGRGGVIANAPFSPADRALIAGIAITVILVLPLALTPPTVRDELIQHLAVPKLYYSRHAIYRLPFMGFSYLPQNIDLLYVVPLAFGVDAGARLIHAGFALLTGLLIYAYLAEREGRTWGLLGSFVFVSTPLVFNLARMAYIDLGVAFYSMMAVAAALKWSGERALKWLIFSAVATGLALGAKYNALITLMLLSAFVAMVGAGKPGRIPRALKSAGLFFVTALVVLSPWLVRNYAWGRHPFYPIYNSAAAAAAKGEGLHITGEMPPMAKRHVLYKEGFLDIAAAPLRIFIEGKDNSIERFDGVLNPVYLAFMALAFIRKRGEYLKYIAAFVGIFFLMAFFTVDLVTRYLMPSIPLLAVIVALGIRNAIEVKWLKWAGVTFVAAMLVFDAVYIKGLYARYMPFDYLSGRLTREGYLERFLPDYRAVSMANRMLPRDARVMFWFAGDRGYYWDTDYYYSDRTGKFLVRLMLDTPDGATLKRKVEALKVTHIFMNEALFQKFVSDNFDGTGARIIEKFFQDHTVRLINTDGFSVFELKRS